MSDELLGPWTTRLAGDLRATPKALETGIEHEAELLARAGARFAPRRTRKLQRSFSADGAEVVAEEYALIQSEGGVAVGRRPGGLVVPIHRDYRPGRAGFVTSRQSVFRAGTRELWAIRRRSVRVRGDRFLERALAAHLEGADDRMSAILPDTSGGSNG